LLTKSLASLLAPLSEICDTYLKNIKLEKLFHPENVFRERSFLLEKLSTDCAKF
jgi:hypothetical protein